MAIMTEFKHNFKSSHQHCIFFLLVLIFLVYFIYVVIESLKNELLYEQFNPNIIEDDPCGSCCLGDSYSYSNRIHLENNEVDEIDAVETPLTLLCPSKNFQCATESNPHANSCPPDSATSTPLVSSLFQFNPPSLESLTDFADTLVGSSGRLSVLNSTRGTPTLCQNFNVKDDKCDADARDALNEVFDLCFQSTLNLEEQIENEGIVTKNSPMHPYHQSSSLSGENTSDGSKSAEKSWESPAFGDPYDQNDYAHHLRSSSYQLLHSRQLSSSSYNHSRQHSNTSNYSDGEEVPKSNVNISMQCLSHDLKEKSRSHSVDSLSSETSNQPCSWNVSEPNLSLGSLEATNISLDYNNVILSSSNLSPCKNTNVGTVKSPPPPPVRDASSLKYIKYGPGHEKFPSWPVPAGAANLVLPENSDTLETDYSNYSSSYSQHPYGSHRSHSWTEQSEYPKERCDYARPSNKKEFSPTFQKQLMTVMEKCEKISPEMFNPRNSDEIIHGHSYSLLDNFIQQSSYYPPYDREGRGVNDKDYNIPSPPERDSVMGNHFNHMTVAQLEEHARRYDLAYGDYTQGEFLQITPLLDQLRQESYCWDGSSERDSGKGESEHFTDSRYSNGRESVTTVVTNSSSASSSETLKWHGSFSDISIMSGYSRDSRNEQNIVHSSRVQTPQRQNSESILYYGRGKHSFSKYFDMRHARDINSYRQKDAKWCREDKNEANPKKYPSYSYAQSLSQISESPVAESRESISCTKNLRSPTVDVSHPPSVTERINELERQSIHSSQETVSSTQKDMSEPADRQKLDRLKVLKPSLSSGALRKSLDEKDKLETQSTETQIQSKIKSSGSKSFRLSSVSDKSHSFHRKDSNCSMSSDSSKHNSADIDRNLSASYTYLDPEKRCKVPDTTLKSIQKQALLSFYERRTGKTVNGSSATASPKLEKIHPEWTGRSFRADRNSNKLSKNSDTKDAPKSGCRRSVSGREGSPTAPAESRPNSISSLQKEDSLSLDVASESPQNKADDETATLIPEKLDASSSTLKENFESDTSNSLTTSPSNSVNDKADDDSLRDTSLSRVTNLTTSPIVSSSPNKNVPDSSDMPDNSVKTETYLNSSQIPKPPDRPPKKSALRSLCQSFNEREKEDNVSKSRSFFFRKPPAPDPPKSPPKSPNILKCKTPTLTVFQQSPLSDNSSSLLNQSSPHSSSYSSLQNKANQSSRDSATLSSSSHSSTSLKLSSLAETRSSSPELPPPPPPLLETNVVTSCDEPFPPPPCDVSQFSPIESTAPSLNGHLEGTFNKDSYVAQRKDWSKTGYEGRYRRMHSPTASDRQNVVNGFSSKEHISNGMKGSQSVSKPFASKHPNSFNINGNLRSAVSTSSLIQRNMSVLEKDVNENNISRINSHVTNGWTPHSRQTSTVVNFTSDELKAFKARKAAQENKITNDSLKNDSFHSSFRPLSRAKSMGEPLHKLFEDNSETKLKIYKCPETNGVSCESKDLINNHDGPAIAHPATVMDETVLKNPPKSLHSNSLPLSNSKSHSNSLPTTSMSETFSCAAILQRTASSPLSLPTSALSSPLSSLHSQQSSTLSNHSNQSSLISTLSTHSNNSTLSTHSSASDNSTLSTLSNPSNYSSHSSNHTSSSDFSSFSSSTSSLSVASSTLVLPPTSTFQTSNASISINNFTSNTVSNSPTSILIHTNPTATLPPAANSQPIRSTTRTCPSMSPRNQMTSSDGDRANIVVLTYGRKFKPEVMHCDILSVELAKSGHLDKKLLSLLAPGPEHKSTASYMNGVFALELRKDLICSSHASHPDLNSLISTSPDSNGVSNSVTLDSCEADSGRVSPEDCNAISDRNELGLDNNIALSCDQNRQSVSVAISSSNSLHNLSSLTQTKNILQNGAISNGFNVKTVLQNGAILNTKTVLQNGSIPSLNNTKTAVMNGDIKKENTVLVNDQTLTHSVKFNDQHVASETSRLFNGVVSVNNCTEMNGIIKSHRKTECTNGHVPPIKYRLDGITGDKNSELIADDTNRSEVIPRSKNIAEFTKNGTSRLDIVINVTSRSDTIRNGANHLEITNSHISPVNNVLTLPVKNGVNSTNNDLDSSVKIGLNTPTKTVVDSSVNNGLSSPINKSPISLPIESANFKNTEAKAKLLAKIRANQESSFKYKNIQSSHILNKKEQLLKSINRKKELLEAEETAITEEISLNSQLGISVTARMEERAKPSEFEKFKLHVGEIDKITSLLLVLSSRLARTENALLSFSNEVSDEKRLLESKKRNKLSEQLDEAKKLKENIDRRAVQISQIVCQYMSEEEYAEYDHFIKMKAKLLMDRKEVEDKILLGKEQYQAILNNFTGTVPSSFK